jgi:hypothetical protein
MTGQIKGWILENVEKSGVAYVRFQVLTAAIMKMTKSAKN